MKFQITLTGEALKELERLKKKEKLENYDEVIHFIYTSIKGRI
jgi:hypothetical protein